VTDYPAEYRDVAALIQAQRDRLAVGRYTDEQLVVFLPSEYFHGARHVTGLFGLPVIWHGGTDVYVGIRTAVRADNPWRAP
jgi:hypothetical protein